MDQASKFQWDRATSIRLAGVLLVIVSLPLKGFPPHWRDVAGTFFIGNDSMRGHEWADITLRLCFEGLRELIPTPFARHLSETAREVFVGASGLINPLLLLYLFFKPSWRTPVLVIFGILVAEAISVFVVLHRTPGTGFFMWVAGTILIIAPPYKHEKAARIDMLETI